MNFSVQDFIELCVSMFLKCMDGIGNMDSKAAFLIGALTWLAVEVAVRKLSNAIRMLILVAIIGSTSVAAVHLLQ